MKSFRNALTQYAQQGMASFHTPGHKGRGEALHEILDLAYDLTELPGLDLLHCPEGVLRKAQEKAAAVFGARETFFLVNGGTCGNQAMLMAVQAAGQKGKILIERRAHRSVISALVLSGAQPDYLPAVVHPVFQLPLGLLWEQQISWQDIKALHVTYPSYYGTVFDLGRMLGQRDFFAPRLPVLVDSAHGAHFRHGPFPADPLRLGADAVLHSAHKTLDALTQSALLHVQGERLERFLLKQALEMVQTSSPSYLLLSSLEAAVAGAAQAAPKWQELREEVWRLQERLSGHLDILGEKDKGSYGIFDVDWAKILIHTGKLTINGPEAAQWLRREYLIEPELWDEDNLLFLLGTGSEKDDVRRLGRSLEKLVKLYGGGQARTRIAKQQAEILPIPQQRCTPREAWLAGKKEIPWQESLGKVCGETISVYPPGIPLIVAGEEITADVLEIWKRRERYRWQGWAGCREGIVRVLHD